MSDEKETDELCCYILLKGGGYCWWLFSRKDHHANQRKIIDIMRASKTENEVVHLGNNFLWSGSIDAFYVKEVTQSASEKIAQTQEELLGILKKQTEDGDEWKQ